MPFDSEITKKSRDLIALERARARIAQGWCQISLENKRGEVCLVGGLAHAAVGAADFISLPAKALHRNHA